MAVSLMRNMIPRPELARADHLLSADELAEKYRTPRDSGEHPRYLRSHWCSAVNEGATVLGYWQWVEVQVRNAHDTED